MKKLLTILAATSMVVSAPLSVIACKKKVNPNIGEEFDYQSLQKELKTTVQEIFNSSLKSDFDDYFFVSFKSGGDNGVDYPFGDRDEEWIKNNKENIENMESPESQEMQNYIKDLIHWNIVESEITNNVLSNVNYKPILVDGKTPLKEGYFIDSIKIEEKEEKGPLSVYIAIGANFYFLNSNQEIEVENLNLFKTSITILSSKLEAQDLNEIKNIYKDTLNSVENANSFEIKSDKGDLFSTAEAINQKTESNLVFQNLQSILNNAQWNEEPIDFNNDWKINTNTNNIIDASITYPKNYVYWDPSADNPEPEAIKTLQSALKGDKQAEKDFIEELSSNDSRWMKSRINDYIKNIKELESEFDDFSESLNSFNLEYMLLINYAFQGSLKNSNFKLEPRKQRNYIALFRSTIDDISFKYNGFNYELPKEQIVIKQLPECENTKVLYKKFITDSYNFQKEFFGFNDTKLQEDNTDWKFYLNKPEEMKDIEPMTLMDYEDSFDLLLKANQKAADWLEPLGLTTRVNRSAVYHNVGFEKMTFNQEDEIYFCDNMSDKGRWLTLKTWFFSFEASNNSVSKTCFQIGWRDGHTMDMTGESKSNSGWWFK
ncbi:lipoprotein [Spiroplasma alleghenense]|uniref:Lipoprotein n=1 Tax=Spiroplasma alleghenense TaxID=216931 RepID=A0A345Z588_9MOLU|nr:lipoprotein [Spiroplasma alleghenense]AXK51767.1 hypothetical protein SALLE_v1c10970 [Spiroplasma alleghenense]